MFKKYKCLSVRNRNLGLVIIEYTDAVSSEEFIHGCVEVALRQHLDLHTCREMECAWNIPHQLTWMTEKYK